MVDVLRAIVAEFPKASLLAVWYPDAEQVVIYSDTAEQKKAADYVLELVGSYFDPSEATQTHHVVISGPTNYHLLQQMPGGLVLLVAHDYSLPPNRAVGLINDIVLRRGMQVHSGVITREMLSRPADSPRAARGFTSKIHDALIAAQRSQNQLLSDLEPIRPYVSDLVVLYEPKDFVGGDFYFFQPTEDGFCFALADYTGHGVQGAMGAMMCVSLLNHILASRVVLTPTQVLLRLHQGMNRLVNNSMDKANRQPGLEILFGQYVSHQRRLQMCSVGIDAFVVRGQHEIHPPRVRFSLGSAGFDESHLSPVEFTLEPGDVLVAYTDGLKDQLDPSGRRRLGRKTVHELAMHHSNGRFAQLGESVKSHVKAWQGAGEQTDDISLIGLKF